jgi:hypothetical protein
MQSCIDPPHLVEEKVGVIVFKVAAQYIDRGVGAHAESTSVEPGVERQLRVL